jgi:hypothetical protein
MIRKDPLLDLDGIRLAVADVLQNLAARGYGYE